MRITTHSLIVKPVPAFTFAAMVFAIALLLSPGATHAGGKPGSALDDCSLITPDSNPANPECHFTDTMGADVWSDIDTGLSRLCQDTDMPDDFKNQMDRETLISKTIDAAVKIDQGKLVPDAVTKIDQYGEKLDSLLAGDITDRKSKAKITVSKKMLLEDDLADVIACLDDILM